ncbi:MAG: family 20 glycosylhydrolase [Deltaproteobacteria bacterium]|nr:family 20 glycosylhydrolase [Deltaproteobacteria bacterium]
MSNGNVTTKAATDILEGDGFLIGQFDDHSALSSLADSARRVQLGPEGYALEISEHKVCLGANNPLGLFYGVQTLLQLMQPSGEGKLSIPQLNIRDWPNMAWRAVHCFPPSEAGLPAFKNVLTEVLPRYKINTLIFEVNYRFPYQSHPEVAEPNAFSKKVYREITALASEHFIQIIPQFNCLGHQSWSKRTSPLLRTHPEFDETPWLPPHNPDIYCRSWCPLHSDVNRFVFDLFDELIDVFQPEAFHVGMDEVFILGDDRCPRCKNKPKHELFAKAVNDLHAYLNGEKGLTFLMWGDRLIDAKQFDYGRWEASENATAEAINLIPQDIIVCDWHYGVRDTYPSLKYFQDKGFRVLAAGWKSPDNVRKFNQYAYQVQGDKMLGQLATTWIGTDELCHALLTGQGNEDAQNVATCLKIVGERTWK